MQPTPHSVSLALEGMEMSNSQTGSLWLRPEPASGLGHTASVPCAGPWICFHCGDTFTDDTSARLHFGNYEDSKAACKIKAGAEGSILRALREAEEQAADAWHLLHNECTDFAKAFHSMRCRHGQALMAAEELGYERGLRDARAEARGRTEAEAEANANLIAAAPELYEALEWALENIQGMIDENDIPSIVIRDRARTALAKARGDA